MQEGGQGVMHVNKNARGDRGAPWNTEINNLSLAVCLPCDGT